MAEQDKVFANMVKYDGIFSFKDFYKFCYDWLKDETALAVFTEKKYKEKLSGDSKKVEVAWLGERELTDYFKMRIEVTFLVIGLTEMEIMQNNKKVKTNKGSIEMKITGSLIRDYKGKFEASGFQKFLRSVYEKLVIPARVDEFQGKVVAECEKFLGQAKAYLDLEGKR